MTWLFVAFFAGVVVTLAAIIAGILYYLNRFKDPNDEA